MSNTLDEYREIENKHVEQRIEGAMRELNTSDPSVHQEGWKPEDQKGPQGVPSTDSGIQINNLHAIAFKIKQGKRNGGLEEYELVDFLRSVAGTLESLKKLATDSGLGMAQANVALAAANARIKELELDRAAYDTPEGANILAEKYKLFDLLRSDLSAAKAEIEKLQAELRESRGYLSF